MVLASQDFLGMGQSLRTSVLAPRGDVPTPVARAEMCLQKLRAAIRPRHFNGFRESSTWCESQFSTIGGSKVSISQYRASIAVFRFSRFLHFLHEGTTEMSQIRGLIVSLALVLTLGVIKSSYMLVNIWTLLVTKSA